FPSRLTEMLDADGENYIEYNYGISGLTTEGLLDMLKRDEIGMIEDADLITIDIGANDILHAMDTFVYAAMATGNISAEEATAVETGYQNSLTTEYENTDKILSIIRDKNPDCEIVFLNIYNPYRYIDLALVIGEETVDLPEYTDGLMKGLNSNISKLAEAYNCKLADCYTAFAMTPLDVLNAKYTDNEQNLDIHPNKDGYTLMATVVYETMKK
ncbi:MAG: SGNH/GDSL hydrolase family protein, partial [Coprococcus sp.]